MTFQAMSSMVAAPSRSRPCNLPQLLDAQWKRKHVMPDGVARDAQEHQADVYTYGSTQSAHGLAL